MKCKTNKKLFNDLLGIDSKKKERIWRISQSNRWKEDRRLPRKVVLVLIFFWSSRNEPTMTRGYRWQGTSSKNKTRWCALSSPSLCLDFSSQWRRWKWRREFQERIGVDHYITNLSSSIVNATLPNFFLLCFSQRVCSWRRLFTISPVQGVFALTVWALIAEAKIDRRE